MVWAVAELLRELRFLVGSGDCSGVALGTTVLVGLLGWIGGFCAGLTVAAILLSQQCRRIIWILVQTLCGPFPAPSAPGPRGPPLRARLGEYRSD